VTIDAMGKAGQRFRPGLTEWPDGCASTASRKRSSDKKADYVLALKDTQGSLCKGVEVFVAEQQAAGFKDTEISQDRTIDGDHDRSKPQPPR
jgi:hypothetical protein